jgi:enoyl-CoA hydratase/carnithine racemase
VYTGRAVAAAEAMAMGLAERVLPADAVLPGAIEDARRFARGPRSALAAAKAAIAAATANPGPAGIETEREAFVALFGTADQREGMAAFLEKREPRFGG